MLYIYTVYIYIYTYIHTYIYRESEIHTVCLVQCLRGVTPWWTPKGKIFKLTSADWEHKQWNLIRVGSGWRLRRGKGRRGDIGGYKQITFSIFILHNVVSSFPLPMKSSISFSSIKLFHYLRFVHNSKPLCLTHILFRVHHVPPFMLKTCSTNLPCT